MINMEYFYDYEIEELVKLKASSITSIDKINVDKIDIFFIILSRINHFFGHN